MVDYETHSLDNCSGWFKKVGKIIKNDKQKLLNKELGELILIYRRRKKLSQEKLGELVNLTRQTIGLIEAGIPDIAFYNMIMLIFVVFRLSKYLSVKNN